MNPTTDKPSDTPRTEQFGEFIATHMRKSGLPPAKLIEDVLARTFDFARQLERENADLREQIRELVEGTPVNPESKSAPR